MAVSRAGRRVLGGVSEGPLTGGGRQLGSPVVLRGTADDERDTKNIPLQCVEGAIGISQVSLGKREVVRGALAEQQHALPRMHNRDMMSPQVP